MPFRTIAHLSFCSPGGPRRQAELVRCTSALWEQWAATLVPGAPPDLVGRGRVFRLLNAAQADTVLA
jgi:hypothetical protein